MNAPNRGEVWLVDLGFAAKTRPCLVLSIPAEDEDRALATLIPHTTSARNSRFEVRRPLSFLKQGVFDAQNLITVPHAKLVRKLGSVTEQQMLDIEDAVCD
jgi:mRNA interferase MazF